MRGVKIAVAVGAIVVGGALIWLALTTRGQDRTALPPTLEPSAHSGSLDARPSPISESPPVSRITPRTFAETAPAQPESASAPDRTVIRGRCLDARTHSPLAGCTVTVGWPQKPGDDVKLQEFLKHPGSVKYRPAQLVTLKDGRFEWAFVPPEPYDFTLTIEGAGLATMCGRWPEPEPGAVVELGDILVRRGTLLRGRVIDENGTPQSGVRINLTRIERENDTLGLGYPEIKESQHDGAFTFRQLLAAGSYRVDVKFQNWLLVEPRTIDIVDGDGPRSVDIHVKSFPDGDAIAGVVTDDRGEPVSGAEVPHSPMIGSQLVVRTGGDGAFRIRRSEREPREAAVSLSASCPGYETKEDPTKYEWGAKGLSIVLQKGRTVTIAVRDGDLGKPVERYGVRCFPGPRSGVRTAEAPRLRSCGEHPDGVLDLDGVCSGRQTLIVEPEGAEWLPSPGQEFEMTAGGAPRQEVTVWRSVKKTLLVKSQSGTPVAGTKIELLRPLSGQTVDMQTRALKLSDLDRPLSGAALLLDGGRTDEEGKLAVTGVPREPLVLRAFGPGHAPVVREVSFDGPEAILEIVVPKGATLVGRIVPLEILPQIDPRIANDDSRARVVLRSPPPGRLEYGRGLPPIRIGDDGTFRIDDIPAGTWNVWVRYMNAAQVQGSRGPPGSANQGILTLGTFDFVDGQELRETFDLRGLLKAQLDGTVTMDGRPISDGDLLFEGKLGNASADHVSLSGISVGAGGAFTALVWPGQYRVFLQYDTNGRRRQLQTSDLISIRAGEKITRSLDFRSSILSLQVVGSDGATPVAGVSLEIRIPDPARDNRAGLSDSQGRISVEDLPAGPVTVLAWPKKYSSPDARRDLPPKTRYELLIAVATVVVTPPESSATIVLPASAGY